ncbi:MAG: SRPBCC family protein [Kribbellaceae bacterium]|nr:SRPBCC family protein [Kribbellaceae bacterium]
MRNVLVDVPVFLSSPLYRRRHLTWNATRPEVEGPMPGDELLPRPSYVSTRAITIDAPPDKVWPWLVQVGCLRAGWYSDDLLDNLGRPSSQTLVPALQHIEVGQLIPMSPTPTVATSFQVVSYAAPHDLLWATRDSTWAWQLNEQAAGRTRVVTRIRATRDWRRPGAALLSVLLLEFGDFAMLRRMLKGIKQRSEANQRPQ